MNLHPQQSNSKDTKNCQCTLVDLWLSMDFGVIWIFWSFWSLDFQLSKNKTSKNFPPVISSLHRNICAEKFRNPPQGSPKSQLSALSTIPTTGSYQPDHPTQTAQDLPKPFQPSEPPTDQPLPGWLNPQGFPNSWSACCCHNFKTCRSCNWSIHSPVLTSTNVTSQVSLGVENLPCFSGWLLRGGQMKQKTTV